MTAMLMRLFPASLLPHRPSVTNERTMWGISHSRIILTICLQGFSCFDESSYLSKSNLEVTNFKDYM